MTLKSTQNKRLTFTLQPNINEIYDTEENEKFMLVSLHFTQFIVFNDFKATSSCSFARVAIYLHISAIPLALAAESVRLKPSTSCINCSKA